MRHFIGTVCVAMLVTFISVPSQSQTLPTFRITDGFYRVQGLALNYQQFELKGSGNELKGTAADGYSRQADRFRVGRNVQVFTMSMCGDNHGAGTFNGVTYPDLWLGGCDTRFDGGEFVIPSVRSNLTINVPFTLKNSTLKGYSSNPQASPANPVFDVKLVGQGVATIKYSICCSGGIADDLPYDYDHQVTTYNFLPATDLNDPRSFVSRHYLDFLSRHPDADGLEFWSGQIAACGADEGCLERKRIDVSAAYLLSIEFQETGYFVARYFKATFNRRPRYAEFLPNAQVLGQNVVVNMDGWERQLEDNKKLFASGWTTSPQFKERYDAKTNEQYVDELIANTEAAFSQTERDALVNGLNALTETRAGALRKIVENGNFYRREFNPAFVQIQYFGYLRRDPDDEGFKFWLGKLNQFNGNFVNAEMVKAFLNSQEYRARFSTD